MADSSSAGSDASADNGGEPAPKKASYTHIKDAPYTRGGQNLNTVYIARDGDNVHSVEPKNFLAKTELKGFEEGKSKS